jgi:hypothetical protein
VSEELFIRAAEQDDAQWMPYGYAAMVCRRKGISHDAMKVRDLMLDLYKGSVRHEKNKTFVKFEIFEREARAYQRARLEERAAREAAKAEKAARRAIKQGAQDAVRRELDATRAWARRADEERDKALEEAARLRSEVATLRSIILELGASGRDSADPQRKQETKTND